ncbi:hypothetical protein JNB91_22310 [Rhizobium wenxiniae]|nr:hypothetical protein [Rhizobium wenxiniae]
MNPFKIFLNATTRSLRLCSATSVIEQSPLDHLDIRAMDLQQLADLPMPYLPMDVKAEPEPIPLARCA